MAPAVKPLPCLAMASYDWSGATAAAGGVAVVVVSCLEQAAKPNESASMSAGKSFDMAAEMRKQAEKLKVMKTLKVKSMPDLNIRQIFELKHEAEAVIWFVVTWQLAAKRHVR